MSESRLLMSLEADAPSADEIQSRLGELKQHISNEDYAAATNTFAELTEEYTQKRAIERSKVARARAARDSAESSFSEQQDATQYIRAATQAATRRTAVHAAVAPLLEQPDEMDSAVAETALDAAAESEESLTTASEQVDSSLSGTTIQPVLALTQIRATESDSSADTDLTVEAQVANVGDELAESIVVTVETADSVTLSETEAQIAELPAQSQRSVEFTGHASSQAGHDVTVTAESEQAVEVSRTDLIVTGEGDTDGSETDDSGDDDSAGTNPDDDSTESDPNDGATGDDGSGSDGSGPGFGVGSALASLGGAGYLLKRRLTTDDSADDET